MVLAFLFYTAMTITMVPYIGLGAELSIDYNERTRIQAWRAVFTRTGAFCGCMAWLFAHRPAFGDPIRGFSVVGTISAVTAVIALWVVVLGVREEAEIQQQEQIGWWTGVREVFRNRAFLGLSIFALFFLLGVFAAFPLGPYINIYYVYGGDQKAAALIIALLPAIAQISGVLFVPLITWLSTRFGKKTTLFWGLLTFGLVPLSSWFLYTPKCPYLQLPYATLLGFGLAAWLVLPLAMIADVCDLDELRTGRRREGAYVGFFTFIFKVGFSFTTLINGLLLRLAGFNQDLPTQAPETILRLRLILMLVPTALILIAAFLILLYPLGPKRVHEMREILEERRRQRLAESRKASA
jgi:GPH family glycoside/pentoside/hexuronide:cation symporter